MRVLFVSDITGTPAPVSARAHADTDLVEALQSRGIEIARADWTDLARGAVDLDDVDLVHLRPAVVRRGPRVGDRRAAGWRRPFARRPADPAPQRPLERRTAAGLLSQVPLDLPIVLTLPTRPAGPVADGSPQPDPPARIAPTSTRPGSRAVHVIATDAEAATGLDAVLPDAHAASVAVIGRGFGEPRRARAFDVEAAVVLASTSPGSAREAATVLRAVEMLGHAGLRFSLVLAGVGPTVRGVQRRVALAEAAGIDVRLLGRASADELARWRATATACVVTSCEPGAQREVADMLLSAVPVVATLDHVHADVAAQASVLPAWFAAGDAGGLASRLLQCLPAGEQAPPTAGDSPGPLLGAPLAGPGDGPVAGGGLAVLARADPVAVSPVAVSPIAVSPVAGSPIPASPAAASPVAVSPVEVRPGDRVLPTWDDIADQTRWVYQQALRRRG